MRTLVPVVVVLCLGVVAGRLHAQSRAKPPEQVLKEAGLTRFGSCYVLAGELQAGKLVKDFDQHAAKLSMELQREVGLEQNLEYKAMEVGVLRQKAQMNRGRGRGRNQSGRINREIRSIERNSVSRERRQIGTLARAASGDQKKMMQDEATYQSLLQSTMSQYADLAGRPEIQAALHSLNEGVHPKIALGPVGAYRARVQHTMMKQLISNGLRAHKGGVFEPDDVAEFTKRVNLANVLYRKLDLRPGPRRRPPPRRVDRRGRLSPRRAFSLERPRHDLGRDSRRPRRPRRAFAPRQPSSAPLPRRPRHRRGEGSTHPRPDRQGNSAVEVKNQTPPLFSINDHRKITSIRTPRVNHFR